MKVFKVYCNEKNGYWRVLANTESEAIYEATKGSSYYTGVYCSFIKEFEQSNKVSVFMKDNPKYRINEQSHDLTTKRCFIRT